MHARTNRVKSRLSPVLIFLELEQVWHLFIQAVRAKVNRGRHRLNCECSNPSSFPTPKSSPDLRMTASNPNHVDEETPLISSPAGSHHRTPLPKLQISIVLFLQLSEPLMSQSIYPYINQVCPLVICIIDMTHRRPSLSGTWVSREEMNAKSATT
jgi:hypothetical protein